MICVTKKFNIEEQKIFGMNKAHPKVSIMERYFIDYFAHGVQIGLKYLIDLSEMMTDNYPYSPREAVLPRRVWYKS